MARAPEATERVELSFEGGASQWRVEAASFTERVNEPFTLTLELQTDDLDAEPVRLLGESVTLTVTRGSALRVVMGIVSEVVEGSTHPEMVTARVVVEPALEALRHRVNTKIFQEMTVPDILDEVLNEGLGAYDRAYESRLTRTYPPCDFRVQYDESDLSFCQRLMQEEGIVYWFEFDGDVETLVLTDDADAWGTVRSFHGDQCQFSEFEGQVGGHEYVSAFELVSKLQATKIATRHFDWSRPSAPVENESSEATGVGDVPHGATLAPEREVYEHDEQPLTWEPGGTTYAGDAADRVRVRREAQVWEARLARGQSSIIGMRPGAVFEMVGHPRMDLDGRYQLLGVTHAFDDGGRVYANAFEAIPEGIPFRPKRMTPKPRIASIQTAIVTGPSGEEIHTDEHGRIKVQLHWDRLGVNDERSSCWVRVMQPWAGAGWGFLFLPRVGMEVVVKFIDGDPDQPMVVGAVYNGEHPPPYALPDEKTKSTIKTETSLGGAGSNELRFEDKAGAEEIYLHAQKDWNEVIENDHTTHVGHDESQTVDNDQVQNIGNDQTETIGANQSLEVDANRVIQVHGDFTETIDGSETRTVSGSVDETIDGGESRTVTGSMTETINGDRTQSIGGSSDETVTGSLAQTIVGGAEISTPATYEITAAAGITVIAPAGSKVLAPGGHKLVAPAGQNVIDGSQDATGSLFKDNFLWAFDAKTWKCDICIGITVSHANEALEITGFKTGVVNVTMSTKSTLMQMGAARLKNGGPVMKGIATVMTYL